MSPNEAFLVAACMCACVGPITSACGGGGSGSTGSSSSSSSSGASSGSSSGASSSSGGSSGKSGSSSSSSSSSSGSSASSSSGASSSGATMCSGPGYTVTGSIFQASEPWNTAVDQDPVSSQSATIISWLDNAGGWGNGNIFQIDTSITVLCADASTPMRSFTGGQGVMDPKFCAPDCDYAHSMYPVPAGGAIEGESGYACMGGGDCHMLVVDVAHNWLWEMYGAFNPPDPNNFYSVGGTILWDLTHAYSPTLRGDGCTSADAGGFPIAAMLFSADEVAAGHIDHAIRFILPNARIQDGSVYVHPATHTGVTSAMTTRPNAPPYGVRLRLNAAFNLNQLNPGAQVVAKALQKYGMFLSDGGNIALTATSDSFTKAKWTDANVNLAAKDLSVITVTDFDVVDLGSLVTTGDSCQLNGYRVP